MAKNYCLPSEYTDKLLDALRNGEITPDKLNSFETSEERRAFLEPYVGKDNVIDVNALIESKLLLKNWKKGVITAIKTMTGITQKTKMDLVSKIERMDKYLLPDEKKRFYKDIASQKLGLSVTQEEAKNIVDITNTIKKSKEILKADPLNTQKQIDYGHTIQDLNDYLETIEPSKMNLAAEIIGIPTTLMSTADFSAAGRQAWGLWSTLEFAKNLPNLFRFAFDKSSYKDMNAQIYGSPYYEHIKQSGLRITTDIQKNITQRESEFASRLIQKKLTGGNSTLQKITNVPGAILRGSEQSYAGFLTKLRVDRFVTLLKAAELSGEDISPNSKTVKDIAKVVNDFTGSGNIGANDKLGNVSPYLPFFSPRKISAIVNMFNPERYLNPNISKTARKAAIRQLVGSLAISAIIIGMARLFGDDDTADADPRSSDFGKVKIGNTRIDVTGGNISYITLLSRIITNHTKSTQTGAITKLGEGYKATTRGDLIVKFFRNKLSPIASFMADWLYGQDVAGNPFKVLPSVRDRLYPLLINNAIDTFQDKSTPLGLAAFATFADLIGFGTNTYSSSSNKDIVIQDTYKKYGAGNIDKATSEIFKELEKQNGKKLTEIQKTNVKKQYAVYRKFGKDKDVLDKALEIYDLKTNDEKVTMLKNLKKEDYATYQKLISQGRSTVVTGKGTAVPVLISDDVYKKLNTK